MKFLDRPLVLHYRHLSPLVLKEGIVPKVQHEQKRFELLRTLHSALNGIVFLSVTCVITSVTRVSYGPCQYTLLQLQVVSLVTDG